MCENNLGRCSPDIHKFKNLKFLKIKIKKKSDDKNGCDTQSIEILGRELQNGLQLKEDIKSRADK